MFFAQFMPETTKLPGQQLKVLMCCCLISPYANDEEGNLFYNNKDTKRRIMELYPDISEAAVSNAINALAKANFLIRICRGQYRINPRYFYKGSLRYRDSCIENTDKKIHKK